MPRAGGWDTKRGPSLLDQSQQRTAPAIRHALYNLITVHTREWEKRPARPVIAEDSIDRMDSTHGETTKHTACKHVEVGH